MKRVIIEYLKDSDYGEISYKAVKKQLDEYNPIKCSDVETLKKEVSNLGEFTEHGILTILSHGHERGLAKGTWESLVTWCELLELTNKCKGNNYFILNLLSVCNSQMIQNSATFCNHSIDEIWITTNTVSSIQKALLPLKENSFDDFKSKLPEEEINLYEKIVKQTN